MEGADGFGCVDIEGERRESSPRERASASLRIRTSTFTSLSIHAQSLRALASPRFFHRTAQGLSWGWNLWFSRFLLAEDARCGT